MLWRHKRRIHDLSTSASFPTMLRIGGTLAGFSQWQVATVPQLAVEGAEQRGDRADAGQLSAEKPGRVLSGAGAQTVEAKEAAASSDDPGSGTPCACRLLCSAPPGSAP